MHARVEVELDAAVTAERDRCAALADEWADGLEDSAIRADKAGLNRDAEFSRVAAMEVRLIAATIRRIAP